MLRLRRAVANSSTPRSPNTRPHRQDHWRWRLGRVRQHGRCGPLRSRHSARYAGCNADLPPEKKIVFRIGINVGDIIIDGDDIFGDGVNVAARLESISEPGGICISDVVHQQVSGRVEALFTDLGDQNLKNIARPVRAYRSRLKKREWNPLPQLQPHRRLSRHRTGRQSQCCRFRI